MTKTPIRFTDLFRYYRGTPHQISALEMMGELIPASLLHRDNEWFKVWSTGGKITPDWLPVAMKIIREFEGCKLDAYLCPAGVWTIGYGTTRMIDGNVQEGDRITLQEAEEYLQNDVEMAARDVFRVIPRAKNWNADRIAALVSFTYNVGAGQLESSTLRKRLDNDEDPDQVVVEELPKWVKGDGGVVLQGLVRRRRAEITLFTGRSFPVPASAQKPAMLTPASPFTSRLTPNIRLGEFALDEDDRRFQHQYQLDTAAELAAFLERVRRNFNHHPIIITSGYRPPAINKACGGAANSEHLFAVPNEGAVDFYVKGADIGAVQLFCDKYWQHSVGFGAAKGFVHLGRRANGERRRWDY